MKILAVCGSPIADGNTCRFIQKAVEPVAAHADVEIVELAGKEVGDCVHCDWCLKNKDPKRICRLEDDGTEILGKVKECDILILATPTYFARMSGRLAALIDRMRPMVVSTTHDGCMTDKPGVALALSWYRNGGVETALLALVYSFLILEMLPVTSHNEGAFFGGAGLTNLDILPVEQDDPHPIESDEVGLSSARACVIRAVKLHKKLKAKVI